MKRRGLQSGFKHKLNLLKSDCSGLMLVTIIKILIAIACLVVLAVLLVSLYNIFTNQEQKQQAKHTLGLIIETMNDATARNLQDYGSVAYITNPKKWWIESFPLTADKENWKTPKECIDKFCICICSKKEDCGKENICQVIPGNKPAYYAADENAKADSFTSVNTQIGTTSDYNIIKLSVKDKGAFYIFSYNQKYNLNAVLSKGELTLDGFKEIINNRVEKEAVKSGIDAATSTPTITAAIGASGMILSGLLEALSTYISGGSIKSFGDLIKDTKGLGDINIIKDKTEDAAEDNADSIEEGAEEYSPELNPLVILAIIEQKYGVFAPTNIEASREEQQREFINSVRQASYLERLDASKNKVECELVDDENYLKELSMCISKQLIEGYKGKAAFYFEGEIPNAEKELDFVSFKPENLDTATIIYYFQNANNIFGFYDNYNTLKQRINL